MSQLGRMREIVCA